jgi:hypothetical protein
MDPRVPSVAAGSFVVHPAMWARFKALATQNPEIGLPRTYLRMDLGQLNAKQLAKVQRLGAVCVGVVLIGCACLLLRVTV